MYRIPLVSEIFSETRQRFSVFFIVGRRSWAIDRFFSNGHFTRQSILSYFILWVLFVGTPYRNLYNSIFGGKKISPMKLNFVSKHLCDYSPIIVAKAGIQARFARQLTECVMDPAVKPRDDEV